MNTTKKVMFASASGAMIGYAVASQLLHGWLFVGIIIGAVAGWFLYDPAQFFASVKEATIYAKQKLGGSYMALRNENWKEHASEWGERILNAVSLGQAGGSLVGYPCGVGMLIIFKLSDHEQLRQLARLPLLIPNVAAVVSGVGIIAMLFGLLQMSDRTIKYEQRSLLNLRSSKDRCHYMESGWRESIELILKVNLITVPFIQLHWLFRSLSKFLIKGIPFLLKFGWLTTIMTFRLAHSNGRLASAVGGALGAFVGLMVGHLIVAMLVGAIAGSIAHYAGRFYSAEYVEKLKANLTGKKVNA